MLLKKIIYTLLLTSFVANIATAAAIKNNTHKLSLTETVKKTLKQNPIVLKNSERYLAAKAALKQAKGGFFPRVDSSFVVGRSNTKLTYPTTGTSKSLLNPTRADITITQPIFSGFSTYNIVGQRKEELKAARFTEKFSKEGLALQAVYAYTNFLRFEKMRTLAISNVKVHKEILAKVRLKYKGGAGPKADVDLAVGRLAKIKALLHNIEASKKNSAANFLKIVGIKPNKRISPELAPGTRQWGDCQGGRGGSSPPLGKPGVHTPGAVKNLILATSKTIPNIPKNLNSALNIALANNPAYSTALANFKAANKAVAVSKSTLVPTINLELSKTYSDDYSGSEYRNNDTRGMLVARYNLFNGASDLNNINRAKHFRQAAMYNMHDTKNNIIEKTTQVWHKLKADKASLTEHHKHLSASKKALEGYKKQFELGRNSLLNVLDMENEVFKSNVNVINGESSLIIDRYELLANMGMLAKYFTNKGER